MPSVGPVIVALVRITTIAPSAAAPAVHEIRIPVAVTLVMTTAEAWPGSVWNVPCGE